MQLLSLISTASVPGLAILESLRLVDDDRCPLPHLQHQLHLHLLASLLVAVVYFALAASYS